MVSNTLLKQYELTELKEYFSLILTAKINGQNRDVTQYIKRLSKSQKLALHYWLQDGELQNTKHTKELHNVLIEILCDNV